jgi:hypothetical protein
MVPAHVRLSNDSQILRLKRENMQVALRHKDALAAQSKTPYCLPYDPVAGKKLSPRCRLAWSGINLLMRSGEAFASCKLTGNQFVNTIIVIQMNCFIP